MKPLRVATYNIHKGLSPLNRRLTLGPLSQALNALDLDLLCLQEVQGEHRLRAKRFHNWSPLPQAEHIAEALKLYPHYGAHAQFEWGHHGNALLGRWPWQHSAVETLTLHGLEQRGLVHGLCQPQDWPFPIHVVSCHLNLLNYHRQQQLQRLLYYLEQHIPTDAPLILAGDFNDWRQQAETTLAQAGLQDAHMTFTGKIAHSFPARYPLLPLDRIYVRGLRICEAQVLRGAPWTQLSDHLPLLVECLPA